MAYRALIFSSISFLDEAIGKVRLLLTLQTLYVAFPIRSYRILVPLAQAFCVKNASLLREPQTVTVAAINSYKSTWPVLLCFLCFLNVLSTTSNQHQRVPHTEA